MMWNSNQIQNFTLANGAWKGKRGMGDGRRYKLGWSVR